MEQAIVKIRFPLGALPVRGLRCPVCGEERIPAGEAEEAQRLAGKLGLFGLQNMHTRKLLKTGNSIAVSLDPDLLHEILPGAEPGTVVKVGRQGDKIVIIPA